MSEQENVELANQTYSALSRGDISALLDVCSEDVEWVHPSIDGVPYAGGRRGRNEIAGFFSIQANVEEVLEFTQDTFIAQGEQVAVEGRYEARCKTTGRSYRSDFVHMLTVSEGKIQKIVFYFDTAAAAGAYVRSASARA